eukprot:Nk52_evm2s147 gene=Nk52_evmTU2s147
MSSSISVARTALRHPANSQSAKEANARVRALYRAWWREAPHTVEAYNLEITVREVRDKIREKFMQNASVTDTKVIDRLVVVGRIELEETNKIFKQKTHVLRYFEELQPLPDNRPKDFLTRFYAGHN